MKTKFFSLLVVSLILLTFSCKTDKNNNKDEQNDSTIVVEGSTLKIVGEEIWIREYPTEGEVVMKLNDGEICEVLKRGKKETVNGVTDYWYKIKHDSKEGWVFGSQTSLKDPNLTENTNKTENNNTNTNNNTEPNADLEKTLNEICSAINNQELDKLKKYFYLTDKIFIIYNPGAFTEITLTDDFEVLTDYAQHINIRNNYKITYEKWPEYSWDEEDWTKQGCFAEEIVGTKYFTESYQAILDYELHEVEDEEMTKAQELGKISQVKVIITELYMRFYFTKKDNKWLLISIDFHDFSA